MTDFDKAFEHVVGLEGGYVNDPQDPGGETKYGISKRQYPLEDIKNLSLERAKIIYRMDYWNKIQGDGLPYPTNMLVFDAAVNQGVTPAVIMLQKTLGVPEDGTVGPLTIKAAQEQRGSMISEYLACRALRYVGTNNFDRYGKGWLRRLFVLAMDV